jgi:hypothetical protein
VVSGEVEEGTVEPEDEAALGLAQSGSASRDRVEDRLDIGRRAGDDAQDLASGRLLLQGLGEPCVRVGQLARARLDLLLQVRVGLLQLSRGAIELVAERLELVPGVDVHAVAEVARADSRRARLERPDRSDHPAGEKDAGQDR